MTYSATGGRPEHRLDEGAPRTLVETVYREYGLRVYALAVRMLGSAAGAEFVTRAVLLRVLRRIRGPACGPVSRRWVYKFAVRAVLATRRARPAGSAGGGPGNIAGFEAAIRGLPIAWRDVFVLSDVEGLRGGEVGRLLGLCQDEVTDRLHRARLALLTAVRPAS